MSRIKLHPTTLLLAWMGFALALSWFDQYALILASTLILAALFATGTARCWRLVRRTRVLLIALLLLYAFTTPGAPLFSGWEQASPSYEGVIAGMQQIWRLLLMMAALAAVLTYLSRAQLLAGIYVLLLPLKPLGVPVTRFAVRLWLTLHYAESAPRAQGLSARWESAQTLPRNIESTITLEAPNFSVQDAIFVLGYLLLIGGALG